MAESEKTDVVFKYARCPECKRDIIDIMWQTSGSGVVVFSCSHCNICLGAQAPSGMATPHSQVH